VRGTCHRKRILCKRLASLRCTELCRFARMTLATLYSRTTYVSAIEQTLKLMGGGQDPSESGKDSYCGGWKLLVLPWVQRTPSANPISDEVHYPSTH
jgi:hypothetical protein